MVHSFRTSIAWPLVPTIEKSERIPKAPYVCPHGGRDGDTRIGGHCGRHTVKQAHIDRLRKRAAQDNPKPPRRATGASAGLTLAHQPDHSVHGQEGWARADPYFKRRPKTPSR